MMKYILVILSICASNIGFASDIYSLRSKDDGFYIKAGGTLNDVLSNTKAIFTGYQGRITQVLAYQLEVGTYKDITQPNGFVGLAGGSIGITTQSASGVYSKLFSGPAIITQTDSRLGGIFEFNTDIELGLKGNNGISLGFDYKHISDAGLTNGNIGRDLLLFKVQFGK